MKSLKTLIAASAVFAGAVNAYGDGMYARVEGGFTKPGDLSYTATADQTEETGAIFKHHFKNTFNAGAAAGYKMGDIRVEAAGNYTNLNLDTFEFTGPAFKKPESAPEGTPVQGAVSSSVTAETEGNTNYLITAGANAYYDVAIDGVPMDFFLGAGVGYAKVSYKSKTPAKAQETDSTTGLVTAPGILAVENDLSINTWNVQGHAGVKFAVMKNVDITVQYRLTYLPKHRFFGKTDETDTNITDVKSTAMHHNVIAGAIISLA